MEEKRKAARMEKTGTKREIKKVHISRKAGNVLVKWMKIQNIKDKRKTGGNIYLRITKEYLKERQRERRY